MKVNYPQTKDLWALDVEKSSEFEYAVNYKCYGNSIGEESYYSSFCRK